jgi:hypothetical protein
MGIQPEMTKTHEIPRTEPDKHVSAYATRHRRAHFALRLRWLACRDGSLLRLINPIRNEQEGVALIVDAVPATYAFTTCSLSPILGGKVRFHLRPNDAWLRRERGLPVREKA